MVDVSPAIDCLFKPVSDWKSIAQNTFRYNNPLMESKREGVPMCYCAALKHSMHSTNNTWLYAHQDIYQTVRRSARVA